MVDPTAPVIGQLEETRQTTNPLNGDSLAAVTGWAALPGGDSGTVVLAYGDDQHFFGQATRIAPEGDGIRWTAPVPWAVIGPDSRPVRASAYDRASRRIFRLEGEAKPRPAP